MKVINSLIAVEVPRGADCCIDGTVLAYDTEKVILPFPCEILGLASEVDDKGKSKVVEAIDVFPNIHTAAQYQDFLTLYFSEDPDNDILFLIKTK